MGVPRAFCAGGTVARRLEPKQALARRPQSALHRGYPSKLSGAEVVWAYITLV